MPKISALTELTTGSDDDILPIVDAPGTTPVAKKITLANLLKGISIWLAGHTTTGGHAVDTISEKTGGAGVTIDGVQCKDGAVITTAANPNHVYAYGSTTESTDAWVDVVWAHEVSDPKSQFDGTTFTAQEAGVYQISANIRSNSAAWNLDNEIDICISINNATSASGSVQNYIPVQVARTTVLTIGASCAVNLAVNDTIKIKYYAARGGAATALADANLTHLSIVKVN